MDEKALKEAAIRDTRVALDGLTYEQAREVCDVVLEEIRQNGELEQQEC